MLKKPTLLSLFSKIIVRISDERASHLLQENEAIFLNNYFKNLGRISDTYVLHDNAYASLIIDSRIIMSILDERA